jgi:hypothetical protein
MKKWIPGDEGGSGLARKALNAKVGKGVDVRKEKRPILWRMRRCLQESV